MPLAQPGLHRKQQNGALPPGRPQWPLEKPEARVLLLPVWGRPLLVPGLPCISHHSQGWLMGKAELTAPSGARGVEGGEGEAAGSCGSRREERRVAVGEVKVISAQGCGRGRGMASKLGLTEAQLFPGLSGRLFCPSAGRAAEGPRALRSRVHVCWGWEEGITDQHGQGMGGHCPTGIRITPPS